ncbi:1-deoxy-D-xylulose 5-phosphate reductoisomerase [compost metagenome]
MHKSGNMPCILNAANEVVVNAFINNKVGFLEMSDIIEQTMEQLPFIEKPNMEELIASDTEARAYAEQLLQNNDY